jgi:integrase
LLAEGIPLKSVSARLGHSGVGITGDLYGHALPSVDRLAADKLDKILKGKDSPEDQQGQEKKEDEGKHDE